MVWRKLLVAVDTSTHEMVAAELTLSNAEVLPNRLKQTRSKIVDLLSGNLSLRNYKAQVGEAYAMIKALSKLTGLGMPETQRIV